MKRVDGSLELPPFPGDSDGNQLVATECRATRAASRLRERSVEAKAYPLRYVEPRPSAHVPEEPAGRLASCIIRASAATTWTVSRLLTSRREKRQSGTAAKGRMGGSAAWRFMGRTATMRVSVLPLRRCAAVPLCPFPRNSPTGNGTGCCIGRSENLRNRRLPSGQQACVSSQGDPGRTSPTLGPKSPEPQMGAGRWIKASPCPHCASSEPCLDRRNPPSNPRAARHRH